MTGRCTAEVFSERGADATRHPPVLVGGEVHVWLASLAQDARTLARLRSLLSPEEIARAERFYRARDRDNFITARGVLRSLLSDYTGAPAARLVFDYTPYGKPSLREGQGAGDLRFNLSHSGSLAAYAFTLGREVGIDIEHMREEFAGLDVARQFFSANEVERLTSLPQCSRVRGFFNCWTRKEAYVKALGEGLSHPLDAFAVSLAPDDEAALLGVEGDTRELTRWAMYDVPLGDHYAAALVVERPSQSPQFRRWVAADVDEAGTREEK